MLSLSLSAQTNPPPTQSPAGHPYQLPTVVVTAGAQPAAPIDGAPFLKSTEHRIDDFAQYLRDHDVMVTVRRSRGKDIDAACGQLANKG